MTLALSGQAPSMLYAVLAMLTLSLVMFLWMYATRIPAIQAAKLDPQAAMHPGSLDVLPSSVRRVADNYNHLFEAPTVFYALVFLIVLLGHADAVHVICAWAYVALRVLHSLVQATANIVALRFTLFFASWAAMAVMIVREVLAAL